MLFAHIIAKSMPNTSTTMKIDIFIRKKPFFVQEQKKFPAKKREIIIQRE
jgi:hypothetical protein